MGRGGGAAALTPALHCQGLRKTHVPSPPSTSDTSAGETRARGPASSQGCSGLSQGMWGWELAPPQRLPERPAGQGAPSLSWTRQLSSH